jgi:hypothetical protein
MTTHFKNTELKELLAIIMQYYMRDLQAACRKLGIQPEQAIVSKTRKREVVEARHLYFWFALEIGRKYQKNWSLALIGMIVRKDHATVLHGQKTINGLIDTNYKNLKEDVSYIWKIIEKKHGIYTKAQPSALDGRTQNTAKKAKNAPVLHQGCMAKAKSRKAITRSVMRNMQPRKQNHTGHYGRPY